MGVANSNTRMPRPLMYYCIRSQAFPTTCYPDYEGNLIVLPWALETQGTSDTPFYLQGPPGTFKHHNGATTEKMLQKLHFQVL